MFCGDMYEYPELITDSPCSIDKGNQSLNPAVETEFALTTASIPLFQLLDIKPKSLT